MEGGIETGDLRQIRRCRRHRADGGEIVRLMMRRQSGKGLEFEHQLGCNQRRCPAVRTAMDHPVPYADKRQTTGILIDPFQREIDGFLVGIDLVGFDGLGPGSGSIRLPSSR